MFNSHNHPFLDIRAGNQALEIIKNNPYFKYDINGYKIFSSTAPVTVMKFRTSNPIYYPPLSILVYDQYANLYSFCLACNKAVKIAMPLTKDNRKNFAHTFKNHITSATHRQSEYRYKATPLYKQLVELSESVSGREIEIKTENDSTPISESHEESDSIESVYECIKDCTKLPESPDFSDYPSTRYQNLGLAISERHEDDRILADVAVKCFGHAVPFATYEINSTSASVIRDLVEEIITKVELHYDATVSSITTTFDLRKSLQNRSNVLVIPCLSTYFDIVMHDLVSEKDVLKINQLVQSNESLIKKIASLKLNLLGEQDKPLFQSYKDASETILPILEILENSEISLQETFVLFTNFLREVWNNNQQDLFNAMVWRYATCFSPEFLYEMTIFITPSLLYLSPNFSKESDDKIVFPELFSREHLRKKFLSLAKDLRFDPDQKISSEIWHKYYVLGFEFFEYDQISHEKTIKDLIDMTASFYNDPHNQDYCYVTFFKGLFEALSSIFVSSTSATNLVVGGKSFPDVQISSKYISAAKNLQIAQGTISKALRSAQPTKATYIGQNLMKTISDLIGDPIDIEQDMTDRDIVQTLLLIEFITNK